MNKKSGRKKGFLAVSIDNEIIDILRKLAEQSDGETNISRLVNKVLKDKYKNILKESKNEKIL